MKESEKNSISDDWTQAKIRRITKRYFGKTRPRLDHSSQIKRKEWDVRLLERGLNWDGIELR